MKVFLLYPDRDFDLSKPLPPLIEALERDLGLDILLNTMAQGDRFLYQVARQVLLSIQDDPAVIAYRQGILEDCLQHAGVVQQLYRIPLEFLERKRKYLLWISLRHSSPGSLLSSARQLIESSLDLLRQLRQIADQNCKTFASEGFRRFFRMIQQELNDAYLEVVKGHIQMLRFPHGVLLRVRLGKGNEGVDYELCKPNGANKNWLQRLFTSRSPSYSYTLHPRDEAGARILSELRDRGLALTANAVAQAAEHIESFLHILQWELAFYMGCMNLSNQLTAWGFPVAFPQVAPTSEHGFSCRGLYDVSLALTMGNGVVGNDVSAEGKPLVLITGPNKGGKTTFLRSVGQAYLMMQSGMFVPAESLSASLCSGLFTHFKREEDGTMESGKFDEELSRMSTIVDHLTPHAILLLNESFAATNEREGSQIAWQIVDALLEKGLRVFYVTHLYEFARRCYEEEGEKILFLRAERLPDGTRTFRLKEAHPMETSHGMDLYRRIFGVERQKSMAG